jgi:hypothetical protein
MLESCLIRSDSEYRLDWGVWIVMGVSILNMS